MNRNLRCGFCGIYPKWLQNWATSRGFIAVYALLGTVQSMAFIYMTVSLTTLEKRFKIPSQTTGIILSGNEISQILSILLIYYGGSGHRPRWIAVGVAFSAISCLVLALPHFIYGPGQDALALTEEHLNLSFVSKEQNEVEKDFPICTKESREENCDKVDLADTSITPRLIVFVSQFILGIGTTLYYVLGQTFMDDNTKKKNTPMLLGITFALRTVGPAFGFVLSYLCLNIYIAPNLHPIIDQEDPRWLGAWWLGWILLGVAMLVFSTSLGMFPHQLRKSEKPKNKTEALPEHEVPLKITWIPKVESLESPVLEKPSFQDFMKTMKRLLTNKLIIFNIFSGVFCILSISPYMSFIAKYLEVQFQTSPGGGTIIVGPLTLMGMILGFLVSGYIVGKFKPSARVLIFWNVIIGLWYILTLISYLFLGCDSTSIQGVDYSSMKTNLTLDCNANCNCEHIKYSPVCHEPSMTTFFSACHAGCSAVSNESETVFNSCSCISSLNSALSEQGVIVNLEDQRFTTVVAGPCKENCFTPYVLFTIVMTFSNFMGCTGRIGYMLLSFRCVETRDKSLVQGILLMVFSLLALIPGPIIFGAIMDSTCLVWDISCQKRGNCWIYHKDNFRYYVNVTAACMAACGVFFDVLVCYLCKGIDLYGDNDEEEKPKVLPPRDLSIIVEETSSKDSYLNR